MLRTTLDLNTRLSQVTTPFVVMHGDADKVTEPQSSEELYRVASATDKLFKLYPVR